MAAAEDVKSELQLWHVTEPYLHLHCGLGEGPYYEAVTGSLRFVDIKKKRVHVVKNLDNPHPKPEDVETIQLDTPVTVTADIDSVDPRDQILIGAKYGIAALDRRTGTYEYIARFSADVDNVRLRSNDGAVDPHGRFWLGTMTDIGLDLQAEGTLFLFPGGRAPAQPQRHPVTIPNSVGWSPDQRTQYFTNSTERVIFAWAYDPPDPTTNSTTISSSTISTSTTTSTAKPQDRIFYTHNGPGEPDGFRVDEHGYLWQAVYGEGRVLRISPAGELVGEVRLPTRNVTCVQFVGTELFITSAAMGEGEGGGGSEEEIALGGALFRVEVGVRGVEPFLFRLG
ncbi:hypothetical protein GGR54DRAFT_180977 [Hypoxylon sp. NC1633]|nr:hypothetical protein GGR54DRAFT_180977 [Hypoxylon sp. NC1633]